MKTLITSILLYGTVLNLSAQNNLVQNGGFEVGEFANRGIYEIKEKSKDKLSLNWHSPIRHNAQLFIAPKKSVAVAQGGRSAIGLLLGSGRQHKTKFEYITGNLTSPLIKGEIYCVSFSTILQRTSKWAASDIGLLFHHDEDVLKKISDPTSVSASLYANGGKPLIGTKWQEFSGYYVASGGEEHISIGKFGTTPSKKMKELGIEPYNEADGFQSKAYYLFDNISVTLSSENGKCGCADARPEPPKTEEEIQSGPKHPPYLFALDASGSMKRGGLFDSLRVNLTRFLEKVPNGTPVSFVTFASSSRKIFTGIVDKNTPSTVDSLLQRAPVGGGTKVELGLQLSYESWQPPDPDSAKMILISDGEFHVNPKIVSLVKNEYEQRGRKLTLIQIGARASGLQQLKPYMDDYVHTTQSELSQVVDHLYNPLGGTSASGIATSCECIEEFSDTMNYHFVIDYSGSMAQEKGRAIMTLRSLFEKAPRTAVISITSFDRTAKTLYFGKKSDLTVSELTRMLQNQYTGGGTDPTPGVKYALDFAKQTSEDRFSHIIIITDLSAKKMSRMIDLSRNMKKSMSEFDLSGSAVTVDENGLIALHSQFDQTTGNFMGVDRAKFLYDLFEIKRSSCDYTSQPYHYNPAKAYMKGRGKKIAANTMRNIFENL